MSSTDPDRLVRPYLITGGRTESRDQLPMETLVEARPMPSDTLASLRFEPRRVIDLCAQPLSVAEVAADLSVPLGVARVIVADLADARLVTIHRTVSAEGPDVPLLERLLDGLSSC